MRWVIAVVLGAALASGAVLVTRDEGGVPPAAAGNAPGTVPAAVGQPAAQPTTTTAEPTEASTPGHPGPPPPLLNTGDDVVAVVRSMDTYLGWCDQAPRLECVEAIYLPDSQAYDSVRSVFSSLVENGYRWDRPSSALREVRVTEWIDGDAAEVYALMSGDNEARLLRADGSQVDHPQMLTNVPFVFSLARDDEGRWFVSERTRLA